MDTNKLYVNKELSITNISDFYPIAITGHRPNKLLGGYNMESQKNQELYDSIRETVLFYLKEKGKLEIICGGALGIDTLFGLVGLDLKDEYPNDIVLTMAIPFYGFPLRWKPVDIACYDFLLSNADKVHFIEESYNYSARFYQQRNMYMTDRCDTLLAVWNGTAGGTKNCIDYAKSQDVDIVYICKEFLIEGE